MTTDSEALVIADRRASYPDMSDGEALAHARNTICVEDVMDGTDWGDERDAALGRAYLEVLK